ncbi:MAG: PIG-L family deacetylase [Myxococcales bacterium]|nr:PIG-L family deacetylase [Myxococcales bacterium]
MRWTGTLPFFAPPRPPWDSGPAGTLHALRRCANPWSVLYVMAHPDDEDATTLTALARGMGARVGIYSLTRGESGVNERGSECFDALGRIREGEMIRAAQVYGADDVFFGPFFDYGYSKRVDEAFSKWDRARLVEELVRAIRVYQPDVVISRFLGDRRDGHAHHQAVGLLVKEAFSLAATAAFAGVGGHDPWQADRLFVEVDRDEDAEVLVDGWDPSMAVPPVEMARAGYAHHQSQVGGRNPWPMGKVEGRYACILGPTRPTASAPENVAGPDAAWGRPSSLGEAFFFGLPKRPLSVATERGEAAFDRYRSGQDGVTPLLLEGLALARKEGPLGGRALEAIEERFSWALARLAGLDPVAIARPPGVTLPSRFYDPFPTVGDGDSKAFEVDVRSGGTVVPARVRGQGASNEIEPNEFEPLRWVGPQRAHYDFQSPGSDAFLPLPRPWPRHWVEVPVPVGGADGVHVTLPIHRYASSPPHPLEVLRGYRPRPPAIDMDLPRLPRGLAERPCEGASVLFVPGHGPVIARALELLGARVQTTTGDGLASVAEGVTHVVIGPRAYSVHGSLGDRTPELLTFVQGGGQVVVFSQTADFRPSDHAPFSGVLPLDAEEVCEEDAPVALLESQHAALTHPYRLASEDFDGWIEQRGAKFWEQWHAAYVPLIETADPGQRPQRGGWLTAPWGAGRYTYCALALDRQLPLGVRGAFRILANLVPGCRP